MDNSSTPILNQKQIEQRLKRLAYQIYEDNADEKNIVIAGIYENGVLVARQLVNYLKEIASVNCELIEVHIDKHSQVEKEIVLSPEKIQLDGKVIILVDDVMNSGKTMMYSMKPFLQADIKKLRTVVLVDRNHRRFPVAVDFAGMTLSTTLQEHVTVEFKNENILAYLS